MKTNHQIEKRKNEIEQLIEKFLKIIVKDTRGMEDTPERVARMWASMLYGYDETNQVEAQRDNNHFNFNQMVATTGIPVRTVCRHHLLPVIGYATVAYVPNKWVIGLSKMNRIVDFHSSKLQLQEQLTEDIHKTIVMHTDTHEVAVLIKAMHTCMIARGVESERSITTTCKLSGEFISHADVRSEFMNLEHVIPGQK